MSLCYHMLIVLLGTAATHPCPLTEGDQHACALDRKGQVICWGEAPQVPVGSGFDQVVTGDYFVCARVKKNGRVHCAGEPRGVEKAPPLRSIAASQGILCGIDLKDRAHCWEASFLDDAGQLSPAAKPPNLRWRQLDIETHYGCGVSKQGQVVCWGDFPPAVTNGFRGQWKQVVVSSSVVCAIDTRGKAHCVGEDDGGYGQLEPPGTPIGYGQLEPPGTPLLSIGSDRNHWTGITHTGHTVTWGYSEHGWPEPLPGRFRCVSNRCGVRPNGSVRCWPDVWRQTPDGGESVAPPKDLRASREPLMPMDARAGRIL